MFLFASARRKFLQSLAWRDIPPRYRQVLLWVYRPGEPLRHRQDRGRNAVRRSKLLRVSGLARTQPRPRAVDLIACERPIKRGIVVEHDFPQRLK